MRKANGIDNVKQWIVSVVAWLKQSIRTYCNENADIVKKAKSILKKIGIILLWVGLAVVAIWALIMVSSLLFEGAKAIWHKHQEIITIICGLIVAAVLIKIYYFPSQPAPVQAPPVNLNYQNAKAKRMLPVLTAFMLELLRATVENTRFTMPTCDADIRGKPTYTPLADGLIIYHFDIAKAEEVNVNYVLKYLRQRVYQWLSDGKLRMAGSPFVMYNGGLYTKVCVDSVLDNGLSARINVILGDADYFNQLDAASLVDFEAVDMECDTDDFLE